MKRFERGDINLRKWKRRNWVNLGIFFFFLSYFLLNNVFVKLNLKKKISYNFEEYKKFVFLYYRDVGILEKYIGYVVYKVNVVVL